MEKLEERVKKSFLKKIMDSFTRHIYIGLMAGIAGGIAGCEFGQDSSEECLTAEVTCYRDFDEDGFGDPGAKQKFCEWCPVDYVNNNFDCNDHNAAAYPGATWPSKNNIDNNCNGLIDEYDECPECYYHCNLADQFEFGEKEKGYKAFDCVDWNKSICGPDNPGLLLDTCEHLSVEMKALAKADFLKVGLIGKVYSSETTLWVTLDNLFHYTHKLNPGTDNCNPIIFLVKNILDPVTNVNIAEDEVVKIIISLDSPCAYGTSCEEYNKYPEYKECGKKIDDSTKNIPEDADCKYGLTKIILTSCSYCNPNGDKSCTICSEDDPSCKNPDQKGGKI